MDIQSSNFVPTELSQAIDHFVCRLCNFVVIQPKECPKCNCVYCFQCNQNQIMQKGKWNCSECNSTDNLVDLHRVVKEVLEKLIFVCPKCKSVKRNYNDIFKHLSEC